MLHKEKRHLCLAMLCGILGCLCYGGGDWLMVYGDTTYTGKLFWLTAGVAQIPGWRNGMAMLLAFPGVIFYGIALFYLGRLIVGEKERRAYHYLNAFGLTPWMCLHLFYIMILYLYAWMTQNGYASAALPACEALFDHLSWMVWVSEALMLPVFLGGACRKNGAAEVGSRLQCACILRAAFHSEETAAGFAVSHWFHQWIDE